MQSSIPELDTSRTAGRQRPIQAPIALLRALEGFLRQRGVTSPVYPRSAGAELQSDPHRMIGLDELQRALERAVEVTNEPALGLHFGLGLSESSFGLLAPLVAHASNLREALGLILQFQSLFGDLGRFRVVERASIVQLRCDFGAPEVAADHRVVELGLSAFVRLLRLYGCTKHQIYRVCFEYARPQHHAAYPLAFGGAERFSQSFSGIELAREALEQPHVLHDAEFHTLILAQARRCVRAHTGHASYAERVRALMRGAPAGQPPEMSQLARRLGLSVRSLRRRLDEERTSYRELTCELTHEAACAMLEDPEFELGSISCALGFSCVSSFNRAFRHRAGVTPSEYRATRL
jgi:AraC-like DNA-binding protein